VDHTFAEINLLVLEGDAAALAKTVSELSGARATLPSGDVPPSTLKLRP
jgi:hypothetical protein